MVLVEVLRLAVVNEEGLEAVCWVVRARCIIAGKRLQWRRMAGNTFTRDVDEGEGEEGEDGGEELFADVCGGGVAGMAEGSRRAESGGVCWWWVRTYFRSFERA